MKTSLDHPLSDAYGIDILDTARLTEFNGTLHFEVELRQEVMRQTLMCGMINPSYTRGIAVALDPSSGAIVDVLNGAGVLGYITRPLMPGEPIKFELKIQKFGKNHICSVVVEGEVIMYPAFIAGPQDAFNAVVGSDVETGNEVSHRNGNLTSGQLAKVA